MRGIGGSTQAFDQRSDLADGICRHTLQIGKRSGEVIDSLVQIGGDL